MSPNGDSSSINKRGIIMRKFEAGRKINFVDENNVFVGYDLSQSCCENANWFISEKEENVIYDDKYNENKYNEIVRRYDEYNIEDYIFHTGYFKDVDCPHVDEGRMVRFKLIAENKPDLYLHLFNAHNGYYGHGFTMKIGGITIKDEYL